MRDTIYANVAQAANIPAVLGILALAVLAFLFATDELLRFFRNITQLPHNYRTDFVMKAILFVFMAVIFCACQASPSKEIVTSKNDGVFEDRIAQHPAESQMTESGVFIQNGSFSSTDESVTFTWNINQAIDGGQMPVLEVTPRFLTGKDIEGIAVALFGEDTTFFDLGPVTKRQPSKSEILAKIQILSQYADEEKLKALMPGDANIENVRFWLEHYTVAYESAPEENPHQRCDWTLKECQYYEDNGTSPDTNSKWLMATTNVNGHDYLLRAFVRDQKDYQENSLFITFGDGDDPTYVQKTAEIAAICRTEKPTEAQIAAAKNKAQGMLDRMGLGKLVVAEAFIEEGLEETPTYQIRIEAVPVFEGKPVLYGDFGRSYIAKESYNSDYPVWATQLFFSANGELVAFGITNMVEVKEVLNENVPTLPMEEIIEKAQAHMSLYDSSALDRFTGNALMLEALTGRSADALDCKVEITKLEYGLARFLIPDSSNFYYAPAVIFSGTIDYCDPDTGEIITGTGNPYGSRLQSLVVVNAVDGTIY